MKKISRISMILFLLFLVASSVFGNSHEQSIYQARVIQVDNTPKSPAEIQQVLILKFMDGPYTGKTTKIIHEFNGHPTDLQYSAGHLVFIQEFNDVSHRRFVITGPVRDDGLYILIAIFLASVVIIAGFQGIRSIISLSLIFMVIFMF